MKILLNVATVITGLLPYALLIAGILNGKVKQSFATWMLWLMLDVIMLIGLIAQDGNSLVYCVFTLGTFFVTALLVVKKQFSWELLDTFVVILVVICVIILFKAEPYILTIASTAALTIAGIPQMYRTWKDPKSSSSSAYLLFSASSLLSAIAAEAWTVPDRLPQMTSAIFCLIIGLFALRK